MSIEFEAGRTLRREPIPTWIRGAADMLGNILNVHIVRKGSAWFLLEGERLSEFFGKFEVDCVFDIGANAGQYARRLREIGYRGFIVSVEPIPQLAEQLRAAAARDDRWFIEETALDETECEVAFNIMANDRFSSLKQPTNAETALFDQMNAVIDTFMVRTIRLDSLYTRYKARLGFSRPFLKMDTQGNDLAVARGAGQELAEFTGLQSELAIKRLYERQCDYRETIDFFEASGFVMSSLVPNNSGHFPDLIEVDCIMYNPTKTAASGLLAAHSGAHA